MPPTFSQRRGIIPPQKELQREFMDNDLKNSIWNVIKRKCFTHSSEYLYSPYVKSPRIRNYITNLWEYHFKTPIDVIPGYLSSVIQTIRETYFHMHYNEIYDFIEYLSENYPFGSDGNEVFAEELNHVFEREFCAYRLVNDHITEITSSEEIAEIKKATQTPLQSVNEHIQMALSHISDRDNPDYRNSIKESISAVEAICKTITGNTDATLTRALEEIEEKGIIELHEHMKDAFKKLYNYTSDAGGIRHSLMDGKIPPDFDDAQFMLVSCSAIVNYLISKANKSGIKL